MRLTTEQIARIERDGCLFLPRLSSPREAA
jgi:hypothetical protein